MPLIAESHLRLRSPPQAIKIPPRVLKETRLVLRSHKWHIVVSFVSFHLQVDLYEEIAAMKSLLSLTLFDTLLQSASSSLCLPLLSKNYLENFFFFFFLWDHVMYAISVLVLL